MAREDRYEVIHLDEAISIARQYKVKNENWIGKLAKALDETIYKWRSEYENRHRRERY